MANRIGLAFVWGFGQTHAEQLVIKVDVVALVIESTSPSSMSIWSED